MNIHPVRNHNVNTCRKLLTNFVMKNSINLSMRPCRAFKYYVITVGVEVVPKELYMITVLKGEGMKGVYLYVIK